MVYEIQAAPRQSAVSARESPAPGPGYYNLHSDFDFPEEGSHYNDTNFIMQLNAARKRQSAAFESKTTRDAFLSDVIQKIDQPGIYVYNDNDSNNNSNNIYIYIYIYIVWIEY